MAIIKAPNAQYNGTSASVEFKDGIGVTNNAYLVTWFKEHGYAVEDERAEDERAEATAKQPSKPKKKR